MLTAERVAARKNFRNYVDVSRYTGMEVEHKHDTSGAMPHINDGHIHPETVGKFTEQVEKDFGSVKAAALN
jgi:hypothetical protein